MNFQIIKVKKKWMPRELQFYVRPETSDLNAIGEVIEKNCYQRKEFRLEAWDQWVDCGANIGAFSVLVSSLGCAVQSFEAEEFNLGMVRRNLELNNFDRLTHHRAIVSDRFVGEHVSFFVNERPQGLYRHSVYKPKKDFHEVSVPVLKFSCLKDYGDCVKMDIEGSEIPILLSAPDLSWCKKLVCEWSFDKEPRIAAVEKALAHLRTQFPYVDIDRKWPPGTKKWTHYPPAALIYCQR